MVADRKLLYECKLLKQIVYKAKNQLGKTVQYRRLLQVYKSLKKFLEGEFVENFEEIIENAGLSVLDSLSKKYLVPVFSVLLCIYSRIHYVITKLATRFKTKVISKKLKKLIFLSKSKNINTKDPSSTFFKIQDFLESIRKKL